MIVMSDLLEKDSKDEEEHTFALETQLGLFDGNGLHTFEEDVLHTIGRSHSKTLEKKDEDSCLYHNEIYGSRCLGMLLTQSDLCEIENQRSMWLSFLSWDMSLELVRKRIRLFKRKIKIVRKNPSLSESRHQRNIYRKLLKENARYHPKGKIPLRHRRSAANRGHGELVEQTVDRDASGGFDWRQVLMGDKGTGNPDKTISEFTSANEAVFPIANTGSDSNKAESCMREYIDNQNLPLWFVNAFRNNDVIDLKTVPLDQKEAITSDEMDQLMYRTTITVCPVSDCQTVSNPFGLLVMEKVALDEANTKKTDQNKSSPRFSSQTFVQDTSQGHPIDISCSLSTSRSHIDSGMLSRKNIKEKSKRQDNTDIMFLERLCVGTTRKMKNSTVKHIDRDKGASNERTLSGNGDGKQKEYISMQRNSFLLNIREWIRSKLKVVGQYDMRDRGKQRGHCERGQFGTKANNTSVTSHGHRSCLPKQRNRPRTETGGYEKCQNLLNKNTNANVKSDELQDESTIREPPTQLDEEISQENVSSKNIQQRQNASNRSCCSTYVEFANNTVYTAQGHKFEPHTRKYVIVSTVQFPTNSENTDADCRIKEHPLEKVNTPNYQADKQRPACVEEQSCVANRRHQTSDMQDVIVATNDVDCPFRQGPSMEAVRSSDAFNQQCIFAKQNSLDIDIITDSGLSRRQANTEKNEEIIEKCCDTRTCGWLKPDRSKAVNNMKTTTHEINPIMKDSVSIGAAGPVTRESFGGNRKVFTPESMARESVGCGSSIVVKPPTFDEKKSPWENCYIRYKLNETEQNLQCFNTFRRSMRTFIQKQLGKEDRRNSAGGTEKGSIKPRNSVHDGNEAKQLVQYQKRFNEIREHIPANQRSINAMQNGCALQLWKNSLKDSCSLSKCHCLVRLRHFETYSKLFRQGIRKFVQEHLNSINAKTDAKQYPSKRLYSRIEGVSLHPTHTNIAGYGIVYQGQQQHAQPYPRHPHHFADKIKVHTPRDEMHWRLPSEIILSFLYFGLELHGNKITSVLDKDLDTNPGQALSDLVGSIQACVDLCEKFFIRKNDSPTDAHEIKELICSNGLQTLDAVSKSSDRTTEEHALTLKGFDKNPPLEKEELSKAEVNGGSEKPSQIHNDSEKQLTPFGVMNKYQYSQIQPQKIVMDVRQKNYHMVANRSPQPNALGAFFREKPCLYYDTEAEITTAKCTDDLQLTPTYCTTETPSRTINMSNDSKLGDQDGITAPKSRSHSLLSLVKNMPTCDEDLDEPYSHDSPDCCCSDPTPFFSRQLPVLGYRICGNRSSVLASAYCKQSKNRSCNYPSSPRNVAASHLGDRLQRRPRACFEDGRRTSFNARRHDRRNSSSRRSRRFADSQSNTSVYRQCENGQCQWTPKRASVSRQSLAENQSMIRVSQAPCKSCNPSAMQECNTCDLMAMEASQRSSCSGASNDPKELLPDWEIQGQSQTKRENPSSPALVFRRSSAIVPGRSVSAMSKIQRVSPSESVGNSSVASKRPSEYELNEPSRGRSENQMPGSKTPFSRKQSQIQSKMSIYSTSRGPPEYQMVGSKTTLSRKQSEIQGNKSIYSSSPGPSEYQMVESRSSPSRKQSGIQSNEFIYSPSRGPSEYQMTGSKTPPSRKKSGMKRNVTISPSSRGPSGYEMAGSKTPLSRKQSRIQSKISIYSPSQGSSEYEMEKSPSRGPSEYQMEESRSPLSRRPSGIQSNKSIYSPSRGPSEYQMTGSKTPPSRKQSGKKRNVTMSPSSRGPSEYEMAGSKTPLSSKQSRVRSNKSIYSPSRGPSEYEMEKSPSRGPSEYQMEESRSPLSSRPSGIQSNKSIYSPTRGPSEYQMTGSKTPPSRKQSGKKRNVTMSPSSRGPSEYEMAGSKTPLSSKQSRVRSNKSIYSPSRGPSEYQMEESKTPPSRMLSGIRSNKSVYSPSRGPSEYQMEESKTPPSRRPSGIRSNKSVYSPSRGPSEYQMEESKTPPSRRPSGIRSNKSIYSTSRGPSEYQMKGTKTPPSRRPSEIRSNKSVYSPSRGPSEYQMEESKTPPSRRPSGIRSNKSIYSPSRGPSEYQMGESKTPQSRRQSTTRSNASSRSPSDHRKVKPVSRTTSIPSKYNTKKYGTPPSDSPSDESFDYESKDATPLRSTTALPSSNRRQNKDRMEMTVRRHKQMPYGIQRASAFPSSKQQCGCQQEMTSRYQPPSNENSSEYQSEKSIPQSRHKSPRAKRKAPTSPTNRDPPMYQQEESVSPPSYKPLGFREKKATPQSSNRSSKYLNGALISPAANMPLGYESRAPTYRASRRSVEYQGESSARQCGCQKTKSKPSPQQIPSRYQKEPRNSWEGSVSPSRQSQSRYERETSMPPSDDWECDCQREKPTSSPKQKSSRYPKETTSPSRSASPRVSWDDLECDCRSEKSTRFQEETSSQCGSGSPKNSRQMSAYLARRRPTGYPTEIPSSDELFESQEDVSTPPRQTKRLSKSIRCSTQSDNSSPKSRSAAPCPCRNDPSEFLGIPATSPKLISSSDEELTELQKVSPSSVSGTGEGAIKKKKQIPLMDRVGPGETSVSCVDDELSYPEGCCLRESTLSHRLKREKSFEYYKTILDQLSNCITTSKRIYEDNLDRTLYLYSEKCRELNENVLQMDPEIDDVLNSQAQNDESLSSHESNSASDINTNPLSTTDKMFQLDPDIGEALNALDQNEDVLKSPERKCSTGSYREFDPNSSPMSNAMNRAGGQCSPQRTQCANLGGRNSCYNEGKMSTLEIAYARCGVDDDLKRRISDYYDKRSSQSDGGTGRSSALYKKCNTQQGTTYNGRNPALAVGKIDAGGFRRNSSIYDKSQTSTGCSRTGSRIDEICSRYMPSPQTMHNDRQTKRSVIMARYSRQELDDSRNNNLDYCNDNTNTNKGLQSPCLTSRIAELLSLSAINEQLCENEMMENKIQFADGRQGEIGGSDEKSVARFSVGHHDSLNRNCNALKHLVVRSSPDSDHSEGHIEINPDCYAASKSFVKSPEQDMRPGLSSPDSNSDSFWKGGNKYHDGTLDKAKHLNIISNDDISIIPENDSSYISTRRESVSMMVKKENLETKYPIVTKRKDFWTTQWAMGSVGQTKTFLSSAAIDPVHNDSNGPDTHRSSVGNYKPYAIVNQNVFKNMEKSSPAAVGEYRHLDRTEISRLTTKALKTGEVPADIKEAFNSDVSTSGSPTLVINVDELTVHNARSNADICDKGQNRPSKEDNIKKEKAFRFASSKTNKGSVEIDPRPVLALEATTTGQLSAQSSTFGIDDIPLDSELSDISGIKKIVSSLDTQRCHLDRGKHGNAFQASTLENSCSACLEVNFTGSEDSVISSFSSDYSLPSGYDKDVPESKKRYKRFEHNGSRGVMIEVHLFGSETWRGDGEMGVLENGLAFGDLTDTPHSQRYHSVPCNINTAGSGDVVRAPRNRALPKKPTRPVDSENETETLRGMNSKPVNPRIKTSSAIGISGHSVEQGRHTNMYPQGYPGGFDHRKKSQTGIEPHCNQDKGDRLGLEDVTTETRALYLSGTAHVTQCSESKVILEGVHLKRGEYVPPSHDFRDSLGKCQVSPLPFRLVLVKVDSNNGVDVDPSQQIRGFYYRKLEGTPQQYVRLAVSGCPVFN